MTSCSCFFTVDLATSPSPELFLACGTAWKKCQPGRGCTDLPKALPCLLARCIVTLRMVLWGRNRAFSLDDSGTSHRAPHPRSPQQPPARPPLVFDHRHSGHGQYCAHFRLPRRAARLRPRSSPVRYPDPDIVSLDKRFEKYKLGNTPIQRLHTGMLWAEGPAWNGVGKYLLWSDIPNERAAALARGRRPRQRLPQSGRQQQRQHVRLRGPADLLRARQPPRRPLRAQRQGHRAGRQVRRQAAQRPQRRRRPSRRRASGSPIPATAA